MSDPANATNASSPNATNAGENRELFRLSHGPAKSGSGPELTVLQQTLTSKEVHEESIKISCNIGGLYLRSNKQKLKNLREGEQ